MLILFALKGFKLFFHEKVSLNFIFYHFAVFEKKFWWESNHERGVCKFDTLPLDHWLKIFENYRSIDNWMQIYSWKKELVSCMQ